MLAARQHGVLSLGQLRALGLSASAVRSRAGARRLHRMHQGVYAVVDPSLLGAESRYMAADRAALTATRPLDVRA